MIQNSPWPAAAIATVVGAIIAALATGVVGLVVAWRTAAGEAKRRRIEISLDVTKLLLDPDKSAAASRRFAVAVVKVLGNTEPLTQGLVLFIPINSRVSVGRDPSNDIRFTDPRVSRFHCGMVSEGRRVFLEDYCSTNGVTVNDQPVPAGGSVALRSGDKIEICEHTLRFQAVHCSKVLS